MDVISYSQRQTGAGTVAQAIPLVLLLLVPFSSFAQNLSIDRTTITRSLQSGEQAAETFTIENTGSHTIQLMLSPRQGAGSSAGKSPAERPRASTPRTAAGDTQESPSLLEAARQQDTLTVIVTVHRRSDNAGKTLGKSEMQVNRQRKKRLLDELPAGDVRVSRMMDGFPTLSLRVTPAGLEAVRAHPLVKNVSRDRPAGPSLGESTEIIGASKLWNQGYTGSGKTVVILDTGFEADHPFIADRIVEEACFSGGAGTSLCPEGQRTIKGPGTASKLGNGHGTHIAGIVAGDGSYQAGLSSGVAPEANIVAIQVFSETSDGVKASREDYISALQYIYSDLRHRYDIAAVNMSLGTEDWHTTTHCADHGAASIIEQLWNAGIATVIASGNEHKKSAVSSPGCIPGAITVGATDTGNITSFSNNSYLIDLLAPGENISSSTPSGFGEQYGTSQAAAHVSGAFAALASSRPHASAGEIRDMLVATGVRFSDVNNLQKPRIALDRAVDYSRWFTIDAPSYHRTLAPGETWDVTINFNGSTLPSPGSNGSYAGAVELASTDPAAPMQTVTVELTTGESGQLSHTSTFERGWNLAGLAVEPDDPSMNAVFPTASAKSTYTWQERYVQSESAAAGRGYWIHFTDNSSATTAGTRITQVAWDLQEGWNLVSGPNCRDADISRTEVEKFGNIVTYDNTYEWDADGQQYVMADILDPTRGYWIHAFKSGTVTIDCAAATRVQGGKTLTASRPNVDPGLPPRPPGTATDRPQSDLPEQFALHGNYPNPFNPSTTVRLDLPAQAQVTVEIVDMLGRTVRTIEAGSMAAGTRSIQIDGSGLSGGTYIYRVAARAAGGSHTASGTMTLLK